MTDLTLMDSDLTIDPGVTVKAGTKAIVRTWFNGKWNCDAAGEADDASWAWIYNRGPRDGFKESDEWEVTIHLRLSSLTLGDGKLIIAMHSTPPDNPLGDPDKKNIVGVEIRTASTPANSWLARAIIYDNNGVRTQSSNTGIRSQLDLEVKLTWDGVDDMTVDISNWGGALLEGKTVTLPGGASIDPLTVLGTRDGIELDDATYRVLGDIEDIKIEWLDAQIGDDWLLVAQDLGVLLIDQNGVWNKNQEPIETQINALGRPWSSMYNDGAGPAFIEISGIIERDSCDILNEIGEFMFGIKTSGAIVELYSPIKYYTILNAIVDTWEMPNDVARILNRDFLLVVKSRREPEIS